jgi:hypothetical protein
MEKISLPTILNSLLSSVESAAIGVVTAIIVAFLPDLSSVSLKTLETIAKNFQTFLADAIGGKPWGEALADMLTADWNEVEDEAKTLATDFAEAVATALEKAGLIKP